MELYGLGRYSDNRLVFPYGTGTTGRSGLQVEANIGASPDSFERVFGKSSLFRARR